MRVDIEKLKKTMKTKKINSSSLSDKADINKATISRLLTGQRSCSISTAQAITQALGLSSKEAASIFFANDVA